MRTAHLGRLAMSAAFKTLLLGACGSSGGSSGGSTGEAGGGGCSCDAGPAGANVPAFGLMSLLIGAAFLRSRRRAR